VLAAVLFPDLELYGLFSIKEPAFDPGELCEFCNRVGAEKKGYLCAPPKGAKKGYLPFEKPLPVNQVGRCRRSYNGKFSLNEAIPGGNARYTAHKSNPNSSHHKPRCVACAKGQGAAGLQEPTPIALSCTNSLQVTEAHESFLNTDTQLH
jgi:hypothetical protein